MAKKNVRVVIPRSPAKMIALAKKIIAKHTLDGASSLLKDLDMTDFAAKAGVAETNTDDADKMHKDAEKLTESRDKVLGLAKDQSSTTEGTVLFYVSSTRDILLGKKKGKEQELGDYGFEVNTSAPPPKPPVP